MGRRGEVREWGWKDLWFECQAFNASFSSSCRACEGGRRLCGRAGRPCSRCAGDRQRQRQRQAREGRRAEEGEGGVGAGGRTIRPVPLAGMPLSHPLCPALRPSHACAAVLHLAWSRLRRVEGAALAIAEHLQLDR
jgi:hypothetical protein